MRRTEPFVDDELDYLRTLNPKRRRTCICGAAKRSGPPCGHYAAYTTGYCRRCGHGHRCCSPRRRPPTRKKK